MIDILGLCPKCEYASRERAAREAIKDYNPRSIEQNREYAGWIYRNPNGTYSYTEGRKYYGEEGSHNSNPGERHSTAVAMYHTHGKYIRPSDEDFSDKDKIHAYRERVPSYLGTPLNRIKRYDPAEIGIPGKTTDLGKCE
nr:DUF4329 domain-containing protein [Undibacterium sp. KW1]